MYADRILPYNNLANMGQVGEKAEELLGFESKLTRLSRHARVDFCKFAF